MQPATGLENEDLSHRQSTPDVATNGAPALGAVDLLTKPLDRTEVSFACEVFNKRQLSLELERCDRAATAKH